MFTIELDQKTMTVKMTNCGPATSGHSRHGDRVYRNISLASWLRLVRWALNGRWISHSHNWYLCRR